MDKIFGGTSVILPLNSHVFVVGPDCQVSVEQNRNFANTGICHLLFVLCSRPPSPQTTAIMQNMYLWEPACRPSRQHDTSTFKSSALCFFNTRFRRYEHSRRDEGLEPVYRRPTRFSKAGLMVFNEISKIHVVWRKCCVKRIILPWKRWDRLRQ